MTDDHDAVMDDDGAPPVPEPTMQPLSSKPDPLTQVVDMSSVPSTAERRQPLVPILAATTAVLLVATILLGLMAFAPRIAPIKSGPTKLAAKALENEEIEMIARRFAKNFVSIDYRTIDADLERMSADATGTFAEQLEKTIDDIGALLKKSKASSKAKALDAAVLSHEDGSALVQVLLRRTKRNVDTKGSETGNQIVNVTLVKTSDGWKVDNLTQLGSDGDPG